MQTAWRCSAYSPSPLYYMQLAAKRNSIRNWIITVSLQSMFTKGDSRIKSGGKRRGSSQNKCAKAFG